MQCNIDDRGVKARRVWGVMNLMFAVLLAAMAFWSGTWWLWILVAFLVASGLFALYEARKKWCVMRAMGIKTKM